MIYCLCMHWSGSAAGMAANLMMLAVKSWGIVQTSTVSKPRCMCSPRCPAGTVLSLLSHFLQKFDAILLQQVSFGNTVSKTASV